MRTNIVGGPSIVFKRLVDTTGNPLLPDGHPERHLGTRIQGGAKCMKNVVGYDAVSLYPWATMQPMPTGVYVRWLPVDGPGTILQAEQPHHSKAGVLPLQGKETVSILDMFEALNRLENPVFDFVEWDIEVPQNTCDPFDPSRDLWVNVFDEICPLFFNADVGIDRLACAPSSTKARIRRRGRV